jgi:hypothetical protein
VSPEMVTVILPAAIAFVPERVMIPAKIFAVAV